MLTHYTILNVSKIKEPSFFIPLSALSLIVYDDEERSAKDGKISKRQDHGHILCFLCILLVLFEIARRADRPVNDEPDQIADNLIVP